MSPRKHHQTKRQPPTAPIEFTRADPVELAKFDPSTKICTMNCGPMSDDPRSPAERQLLCDDCMPDSSLCYVQDSRSYVGNCPLWWRPEGKGYTTNLDEAGRYTFDEAMRMHEIRSTDIPWFCREIDPLRRATVDCQYMPRDTRDQGDAMISAKEGGAA